MKRLKLDDNCFVKDNGKHGVLVFCGDSGKMLLFKGIVAKLVLILDKIGEQGLSLEELKIRLQKESSLFKKSRYQDESLKEAVSIFKKHSLL